MNLAAASFIFILHIFIAVDNISRQTKRNHSIEAEGIQNIWRLLQCYIRTNWMQTPGKMVNVEVKHCQTVTTFISIVPCTYAAILMVSFMFLPSNWVYFLFCKGTHKRSPEEPSSNRLVWEGIDERNKAATEEISGHRYGNRDSDVQRTSEREVERRCRR